MPRVPPPGLPLAGISGDQRISCQLWDTQFWSNSSVIGQKGWWTKSLSYTHSIWYLIPFTASANVLPTLWYQLGRHRDPLLPSCTLYCCHHVCTFSLAYAFYILECHQRWSTVCLLGINMAHTGITAHVKINIYSFIRSAEYVCELFFFFFPMCMHSQVQPMLWHTSLQWCTTWYTPRKQHSCTTNVWNQMEVCISAALTPCTVTKKC